MSVIVTRNRVWDYAQGFLSRANGVQVASPWISPGVASVLARRIPRGHLQILTFPTSENSESIRLFREYGHEVSVGPVHAKLIILQRHNQPWHAIFGSENLTGSHYDELVVSSTSLALNSQLETSYSRFRSRCVGT